jgi:hypothetical protein
MEKIKKMDPKELAKRTEVKALWDKGLIWSLAHRRSFHYHRGVEMPKDGFYDYQKVKEPIPLTEVELALLCWAGAGTSGLIRNDLSFKQGACTLQSFEARTTPMGCNVWFNHLMFSNDDGIFLYTPHVPIKTVEIETQEDMEVIFRAFKEGIIQLSDQPIRVDKESRAVAAANRDSTFKPGTTVFFPIVETTVAMINLFLINFDADRPEDRYHIVDDMTEKSAGCQKWVDNGYLKGAEVIPLCMFEPIIMGFCFGNSSTMNQNMQLCAAAMGLGGTIVGGVNFMILMGGTPAMRGLGFRFASDKRGYPYPVGIDGVFEAHMPPCMSMDEAVDDIFNMKWGPDGRYNPAVKEGDKSMYPGFSLQPRAVYRPFKDPDKYTRAAQAQGVYKPEAIQVAKDTCNYIYNTYGRLPRMGDPFVCSATFHVSHIDPDFYDEYTSKGSISEEQRNHLRIWH